MLIFPSIEAVPFISESCCKKINVLFLRVFFGVLNIKSSEFIDCVFNIKSMSSSI